MSCKCKNIIENFQGGTIPLDTIFNGNVQICGPGKSLNVSQIDGCSPTTIGSQSGCTSATTTVLIVSGKTNFSCDINVAHGGMFSGGTNLMDIFTTVPGTDINVTGGTYSNTTGCATFTTNQGDNFDICGFMTGFTNNFITGGTFNSSVGVLTLLNNNGNTFDISGFTTNPIPTFTGNTSATCINELWVSNISGCSPVTIGTELITDAGLKTDFIRYNSSADTMFIGSDFSADTRIELRKSGGELKIWSDSDLNLYGETGDVKLLMSDVMSLEAQEHTFLHTSPYVKLKRTVSSADTIFDFVSPANVSSTKLYYKGGDSTFRINTFNGVTSEEALKIDLNQNVELSSNLNVSGNTNIAGDLSTRDITANDIILDTLTPDKPSITLKRASVTGAKLELGFGGNDNGILRLNDYNGLSDILLQGGGISYFPQSLKIGVPYTYPESNPATLTVGGDILTSGNTNTLGTISSGGTNLDQLFAPISSSGGGGTFTGNTSATCINELWVSNIFGCSPLTIGNDSGSTSGNTTLVVSGSSVFGGDVDIVGNIYSGGTNLLDIFSTTTSSGSTGGGGTFTGNTSATCINELWVSNISGCSPVTIGTELEVNNDATFGGKILLGDGDVSNNYAGFGNNDDLKIFHNGAHSIIRETGTGNLYLQSDNNVILSKDSSTEPMVKGIADGAVELYHNNIKKLETTTDGVDIVDEAHIEGATPHLTLQRTDNANVPTIRFKGSGGVIGANINFDGTSGNANELAFQIYDGASIEESFRVTYGGAKVSGELNVTSGLTVTSSGTNTSDTVFLVQDSVGNHIIEGLDTGQVHVGDLVNSALPTNPTLMIGAGKTPNDRGSLAFTSSGIGIGGDNDATGDFLHFLLPGSDDSRWRFDTSSAFGFTLISRQSNAFGSGAGTRSSIYTSRTYGIDFLLGYSSGLGVTDTVGYRFNTKDSTSAGANDIERFVIENGASETKSYFDNISVLGIGTPNPDTNVRLHVSGDTLIDGGITGNTLTLNDINFISGTTGNTVSTLGIDDSGNVVEQKKVVTVTLGPSELIGSVAGTNYLPPITVPPNKYAKVTVHRIYIYNSVAYDGSLVFGLSGPSNTYFSLPTGTSNAISEGVNFQYVTTGNPTPQFGIWHSVGTAPTVGDGTMKFRLEYEFFDL